MEKKINIAELLKDCPSGMELDSPVWNNIVFEEIDGDNIVIFRKSVDAKVYLTQYGEVNSIDGKCVIYPKGETTWEGFVPPCKFKDGDIVATETHLGVQVFILQRAKSDYKGHCYIGYDFYFNKFFNAGEYVFDRLVTEEEKQKLFDAIKANGYKWNAETKTLEKIEPNFKVGDEIREKNKHEVFLVSEVCDNHYHLDEKDISLPFHKQDDWELVPNKFDIATLIPFESKVLVRDDNKQKWKANFWGFYNNSLPMNFPFSCCGTEYAQCIPYEGNEHLLGKKDDCNEFYKTWE